MRAVLVSGGAGYIGSHTVKVLVDQGYEVIVIDNLVTGFKSSVPEEIPFYDVDISDRAAITRIVQKHGVDSVIHFAARSLVGESVAKPDLYFYENTAKSNMFASALIQAGVKNLVFSSTAATYGIPDLIPIPESSPTNPINPYGQSKLMVEQSLYWLEAAYGLKWIALRYFNAAGAAFDGSIGEHHENETHLIPLTLQAALGQRENIKIFGTDYNTPDGTCIRDYIHVLDLADVHILALEALHKGVESGPLNVGTGHGYSVREVIETAKKVTGIDIPTVEAQRRAGDPAVLVAKVDNIKDRLKWKAKYSDINTVVETAWKWHKQHPLGYKEF